MTGIAVRNNLLIVPVVLLAGAICWTGSASGCPLINAKYIFEPNPNITMTFKRVARDESYGWSILGVYPIIHHGQKITYYGFGAATNGDLLITARFEAALVVEFSTRDGLPYQKNLIKRAAPRLITRGDEGTKMKIPGGRWRLRCK
jgi:hypothetical protein